MKKILALVVVLAVALTVALTSEGSRGQEEKWYYKTTIVFSDGELKINLPNEVPDLGNPKSLCKAVPVVFADCECCPERGGLLIFIVPPNTSIQYVFL